MSDHKIVLAFCGKAGCGKDTAAAYLVEKYGFTRMAFADQLKKIATEQFGWDGLKDEKGRKLLQVLGTEAGRAYNENFWIDKFFNSEEFKNHDKIVITDCRFPNEIEGTLDNGGQVVLLEGRGGLEGAAAQHASETALDDYDNWLMVFNNSKGFSELYVQLDMLMSCPDFTEVGGF